MSHHRHCSNQHAMDVSYTSEIKMYVDFLNIYCFKTLLEHMIYKKERYYTMVQWANTENY